MRASPVLFIASVFCHFSLAYKDDILQHQGFLGRVGNKAYLVERAVGTWAQAKLYCEQLGMILAKIETTEELDFLKSKYQSGVFSGWHWTAARDSHRPEQFFWDDKNSSATLPIPWIAFGKLTAEYLSCAAFTIKAMYVSEMFMVNCDHTDGHVLCEI